KLYDPHQDREYVTQKRESDYGFFSRLAAEEGISFWFEDEIAFFSDSHLGMTAGLPLTYSPQPETAHGIDAVYQVRL
ncbi:contractile injection system protein, VgrG/Pvc8 family, partial [Xenorhabdus szentirmaii]